MQIRFLELAQLELDEAIEYYDRDTLGLGTIFLAEVLQALDRIGSFPEAWHPFSKRTRRCMIRRFPYAIVYQVREKGLLIIAIANLHRKPDYWTRRT